MCGGSVVMDWDQIVRYLTVSSNGGQAFRLMDGAPTTFWQSSGTQGKVRERAEKKQFYLHLILCNYLMA